MLGLNFWLSPVGLGVSWLHAIVRAFLLCLFGLLTKSLFLSFLLISTDSLAGRLDVRLIDAQSNQPLNDAKVVAYQIDTDGDRVWYSDAVTDIDGQVAFELEDIENGQTYMLGTTVFNHFRNLSAPLTNLERYDFVIGKVQITLTNGSEPGLPVFANQPVTIKKVEADGDYGWYSSATTDDNGVLRLNLPFPADGHGYVIRAKSSINQQSKYSEVLTGEGDYDFVVGNKALVVTLIDAQTGLGLHDYKVTVYRLDVDDSLDWFTSGTSDSNGVVLFDLPGLGKEGGSRYILKTKVFNDTSSYSTPVEATGTLAFKIGTTRVEVINGSVMPTELLAEHKVSFYRVSADGSRDYVRSMYSDADGIVRVNLAALDEEHRYIARAKSLLDGSIAYEAVVDVGTEGGTKLIVGSPPVIVNLSNVLTGIAYPNQKVSVYRFDEAGEAHWHNSIYTDEKGVAVFELTGITQGESYKFKARVFATGSFYSEPVSTPGEVDFAIGGVPLTLVDKTNERLVPGQKVTAYQIANNGDIEWVKSGYTNSDGQLTFDLQGLSQGQRYVFRVKNPYGEGRRYYGPVITDIGAVTFNLKQGEYGDIDLTAPEIAIATPTADIANAGGFSISGVASDNQAVEHIELLISDPVAGEHTAVVNFDEVSQRWQADIRAQWISAGQSAIVVVTAFDYAQNNTQIRRSYLITEDTAPPVIAITSHQDLDLVNVIGFTVHGMVTDDIGVESISATISDPLLGETVTNQALNISIASGQWALPVNRNKVSAGEQVLITLVAIDVNGKSSEQTLRLTGQQLLTDSLQLAQRITFGVTPSLLARFKQDDGQAQAFLAEQLNPDDIDDADFEAQMAATAVVEAEDLNAYLLRYMTYSKKQLREVMAWFWENHFSTNINTHESVQYELRENKLFRQHALGKFRDLLASSAKSPAMIRYLNNDRNIVGRANENYAREVMELHTLGVDGGYTATDIAELSRVFTGWHELDGDFWFNDDLHDSGNKVFLSQSITGAGVEEGEQVLDILAAHPSTAHFICGKLVTLFVSDQVVSPLQSQCAAEFLATDGDIRSVLLVIFNSAAFNAPQHYRSKIKTPLELVLSTVRGFDAQIVEAEFGDVLADELSRLGMPLFEFPAPTGYSEVAEDWLNSNALLQRMRFVNKAAWQNSDVIVTGFRQMLLERDYHSVEAVVSYVFELAMANEFSELEYQIALDILNEGEAFDINGTAVEDKLSRLLGSVLSFPGFQYQ